ncbi:transcriptional regulator%2C y4mF family [Bordetella ansorpii]|uniref:Transcriptional regulator, y4mF family n=2 Tax=Bordetella ansorpii TaxID=288768 RepID=A0A157SMS2_9BORD|nr:transcriptional regulator%2C y4mF family [Bordetella ansorpii]
MPSMKTLDDLLRVDQGYEPVLSNMLEVSRQIGERLRRQRVAFDWRQADVAERAGVSVQTVKAVEKGDPVSGESLLRLLLAFGHGCDLIRMLESPHFPDLDSHQRYVEMGGAATSVHKRVRGKAGA